jgi:hypothetical protein
MVLLLPVLMLMVLFVLWAGNTGQARLAADLAAEEALVAAAVCCDPDDPDAGERREQVVASILAGRPELDFLCVGDPQPLDGSESFVSVNSFDFAGDEGPRVAVGVLGLGFGCTTDAAVGVLGGVLPPTEIRARAAEVVLLEGNPAGVENLRPLLQFAVGAQQVAYEEFGEVAIRLDLDRAAGRDGVSFWWRTEPYEPTEEARGRPAPGDEFGYCPREIDDEGDSYDPAARSGEHWDYGRFSGRVLIQPGETSERIVVPLYDDCLYESNERFKVRVYGESESTVIVDKPEITISIQDNDDPPFLALVDPDDPDDPEGDREVEVVEGEDVPLEVWLRNDQGQRIISGLAAGGRLNVLGAGSTASSRSSDLCPADFADPSGDFTVAAGSAAGSLLLRTNDDDVYELEETVELEILATPPSAQLDDSMNTLTVTIGENEEPPVLLLEDTDGAAGDSRDREGDRTVTVAEGVPLRLTVRLVERGDSSSDVVSGFPVVVAFEVVESGTAVVQDPDSSDPYDFRPPSPATKTLDACQTVPVGANLASVAVYDDSAQEQCEEFEVRATMPAADNEDRDFTDETLSTLTVRIDDSADGGTACPPLP